MEIWLEERRRASDAAQISKERDIREAAFTGASDPVTHPAARRHNCGMRTSYLLSLLVLIGLSAASCPAMSEPLEQPTVKTTIQIERERGGACATLHAGKPGAPPTLNMNDVCHGWTTTSCADMVHRHEPVRIESEKLGAAAVAGACPFVLVSEGNFRLGCGPERLADVDRRGSAKDAQHS